MDQKHMMEERENNYTLTLEDVRESSLGEYTCSAVNKIGDGQAVVFLTGVILRIFFSFHFNIYIGLLTPHFIPVLLKVWVIFKDEKLRTSSFKK